MGPQDNHLTVMTDLIQLYNRDTRENIMFTFYVLVSILYQDSSSGAGDNK